MTESLGGVVDAYWGPSELYANLIVFLNVVGALILGLIVGYERSYRGRAAGMRTYGMVCMAACALTVITGFPELWYGQHAPPLVSAIDPGRIIQGIVTGIGFLGAGVIMRDGMNISGLTTAASIWATAAIGVLVGVGLFGAAILLTVISAIFMMWGGKIEGLLPSKHAISVTIRFRHKLTLSEDAILSLMKDFGYEIARGSFSTCENDGRPEWKFVGLSLGSKPGSPIINIGRAMSTIEEIESYNLSYARN